MNVNYVVTGAAGFLGSTVVETLLRKGETHIRCLVLPDDEALPLKDLPVEIIHGDVTDKESLEKLFEGLDGPIVFIHCAAIISVKSKRNPRMFEVNVQGTKNVAEACLKHHARLVYVNSVHGLTELPKGQTIVEQSRFEPDVVVGDYAKSKAEAANIVLSMCHEKGLDAVIVHPSGIVGPGDYGRGYLSSLILDFGNGKLTAAVRGGYDFVDVRDVAKGIVSAASKGRTGECYILSNKRFEITEILDIAADRLGKKRIRTILPMWLAKVTAPLSELYYKIKKEPPLYTSYSLYTITSNSDFSHEKADKELGYTNLPIRKTIEDTVDFFLKTNRLKSPAKPASN